MSLGSGLALITIGAILAFAVQVDFRGVDIQVVGYILMIAGLIPMTLTLATRRRRVSDPHAPFSQDERVVHDHDMDV